MKKTSKSFGWKKIAIRLILAVFAVMLVVRMLDMQVSLAQKEKERELLAQQIELQEVENKELERKLNDNVNENKLERNARESLDYIGKDERVFIDRFR